MEIWVNGAAVGDDVDHIIPGTRQFPYWTIYTKDGDCIFLCFEEVKKLRIKGGDVNGTVRQTEVSDVRSLDRDNGSDEDTGAVPSV